MIQTLRDNLWDPIMDPERNQLSRLPKPQRYRIMIVLAVMWSFLFCLMLGWMAWVHYWAIGHVVAIAIGSMATGWTLNNTRAHSHRDLYRSEDGRSVRYDDLWGA